MSTSPRATWKGWSASQADARSLPFDDHSFSQVLLVSTLEHVGADNTVYGLQAEQDEEGRVQALRELRRVLRPGGSLLVTVPLGEPGDHGWFWQDDVRGWTRLFRRAGMFVEEQESYELVDDGWRPRPVSAPTASGYGDRGPAASAVLCSDLSPGASGAWLTPSGPRGRSAGDLGPLRHRS